MSLTEMTQKNWFHFSIDDVFESLIEVTDNDVPLFEQKMFKILKEMHDIYGGQVDLELFLEKEIDGRVRSLAEVRSIQNELIEAGSWLKFAPHAKNYQVAPYQQSVDELQQVFSAIYSEIDRFAGANTYTPWVRLHYYSEAYELKKYFHAKGVVALFTTDNLAGSHRNPNEIGQQLVQTGTAEFAGMQYIRTHYRLENFTNSRLSDVDLEKMFADAISRYGHVIYYSHEYEFNRSEVRSMYRRACSVLDKMGLKSIDVAV